MRVLVTGGGGFFGRHVLHALAAAGHEGVGAGHDAEHPVEFRLEEQVADLFAEVRPDAILHLAGTARRDDFGRGPAEVRTENVAHPLLNVIEAAGARRIVHVSSAAACGEGPFGDEAALRPRDLFGAALASAEVLGRRRAGGDFLVLRPFLLLGEGAPCCTLFPPGSPWNREDTEVDVLDVHDAALAAVRVLEAGRAGAAYTVASGRTLPLSQLVATGRLRDSPALVSTAAPALRWSAPAEALRALGWSPAEPGAAGS